MAEKKLRPGQKIKMVSVDELLGCAGEESSLEININRIQPFQNHPFSIIMTKEKMIRSLERRNSPRAFLREQ